MKKLSMILVTGLVMSGNMVSLADEKTKDILSLDTVDHVLADDKFPGDAIAEHEKKISEIENKMAAETTEYRNKKEEEARVLLEQERLRQEALLLEQEEALLLEQEEAMIAEQEYRYESLNDFFAGTSFEGLAETFITVSEEYQVPVDLLVSISAHETGYGKSDLARNHNNYGGVRCTERASYCVDGFSGYDSVYQGISDKAYLLREYYIEEGLDSLSDIQPKYCPLSDHGCDVWYSNISQIIEEVRLYTN